MKGGLADRKGEAPMPRRSGAVMHGYSIYTPNARVQVETNRPAKRRARALNEEVERRVDPAPEPLVNQGNIPLVELTPDRVHALHCGGL